MTVNIRSVYATKYWHNSMNSIGNRVKARVKLHLDRCVFPIYQATPLAQNRRKLARKAGGVSRE